MNPPDEDSFDEHWELSLTESLRQLSFPQTPTSLEYSVRSRLRRRRVRRRAGVAIGGAALLGSLVAWIPTGGRRDVVGSDPLPVVPSSEMVMTDQELADLMILPPVDLLVVMDRRQDMFIHELEQEAPIQ